MKTRTILSALLFATIFFMEIIHAEGKNGLFYYITPGSEVWIEGTSNVNSYSCSTGSIEGFAELMNNPKIKSGVVARDKAQVTIIIHTLDCGNSAMNKDMFRAMKSDEYPEIKYELTQACVAGVPDSNRQITVYAKGNLTIAGKKKTESIKVSVEKMNDGSWRLVGSFPISMSDYGIIPPEHLLGLIKANNKLVVHFDLLVSEKRQSQELSISESF